MRTPYSEGAVHFCYEPRFRFKEQTSLKLRRLSVLPSLTVSFFRFSERHNGPTVSASKKLSVHLSNHLGPQWLPFARANTGYKLR